MLGYASPRRMLAEAMRSEIGLWAALHRINPWGESRADLRAAIGHALFANANRDRSLRPQPFRTRDFMPYLEPTAEERARELGANLQEALAGFGGGRSGASLKRWRSEQRRRLRRQ